MIAGAGLFAYESRASGSVSRVRAAPKLRCRPIISGALWWLDPAESAEWGTSGWREELEQQRKLGFDLLWLSNAPAALDHPADPLKDIMDLCARRKVQVILDTGMNFKWYLSLDLKGELAFCSRNIERIGQRFGSHPAFYAWYVPHEIYGTSYPPGVEYMNTLYPALVEKCKKAADLPVTLSPFFILDQDKVFGDFEYFDPDKYHRYWAALIKRSGFDIIMLQDSGEHFSYVTNEQRRPFFEAMLKTCRETGARLWGNVETAEYECPSIEEYVRRYGRVHSQTAKKNGLSWRPVPIERLKQKLELAAQYSEQIVTWGYQHFCRPALGPDAARWYEEYRGYAAGMKRRPASASTSR